jgi:hypothetical protein
MRASTYGHRTTALTGAILLSAIAMSAPARATDAALAISVIPAKAFAPATVQAFVRVARHAENRLLRVTLDSGSFYRSSDLPLQGAEAPTMHWVRWPSLPPGNYVVVLELVRADGTRKVVEDGRIEIVGE